MISPDKDRPNFCQTSFGTSRKLQKQQLQTLNQIGQVVELCLSSSPTPLVSLPSTGQPKPHPTHQQMSRRLTSNERSSIRQRAADAVNSIVQESPTNARIDISSISVPANISRNEEAYEIYTAELQARLRTLQSTLPVGGHWPSQQLRRSPEYFTDASPPRRTQSTVTNGFMYSHSQGREQGRERPGGAALLATPQRTDNAVPSGGRGPPSSRATPRMAPLAENGNVPDFAAYAGRPSDRASRRLGGQSGGPFAPPPSRADSRSVVTGSRAPPPLAQTGHGRHPLIERFGRTRLDDSGTRSPVVPPARSQTTVGGARARPPSVDGPIVPIPSNSYQMSLGIASSQAMYAARHTSLSRGLHHQMFGDDEGPQNPDHALYSNEYRQVYNAELYERSERSRAIRSGAHAAAARSPAGLDTADRTTIQPRPASTENERQWQEAAHADAQDQAFGRSIPPALLDDPRRQSQLLSAMSSYAAFYQEHQRLPTVHLDTPWDSRLLPPYVIQWLGQQDGRNERRRRHFDLPGVNRSVQDSVSEVYNGGYNAARR